jgi:[protein-PII] uridylyltransferase
MANIRKPRDIVDVEALQDELASLVDWSGYTSKTQTKVLEIFKAVLRGGDDEIRRRFEDAAVSGSEVVHSRAFLVDQIIRAIHDFALEYVYPVANPTKGELLSIVATGGYGRSDLAPYSDIDLMFLLPYKRTPHTEQVVEFMLYMLWDMGLKVGHATRSINDVVRLAMRDTTILTSLLEARWLWGDKALFRQFKKRFNKEIVSRSGTAFVESKLAERDARHERMGDTRYVLEPNIKEGKGGLRDLQTLFWIGKFLYQVDNVDGLVKRGVLTPADAYRFNKAQHFLWTVRCHLHYLSERPEERLTFNVQDEIGQRMTYRDHADMRGVEMFMKHYFLVAKDVGDLTRVLCAVLEEQHKKRRFRLPSFSFLRPNINGFEIDGDRLTVADKDAFAKDPVKMIRLFHEAQRHGLDIHPKALRLVDQNLKLIDGELRSNPEANRWFMDILCAGEDPETTLKRLNEAGVLGRFIPDFGHVVGQMQYDMYHVYTVDEHTIRAIGILHQANKGLLKEDHPLTSSTISEIQSRRALYLAVLLHDIAKGRGGDHSRAGAKLVEKLGRRFGMNDWEMETASWLVRHHLAMSATAFKRDLDDPKTISDFVALVQSPERLRLLLTLTIADIKAVGPSVWNGWKAGLLRQLYNRAHEEISGGSPTKLRDQRVKTAKDALRQKLADWDENEVEKHIAKGYPQYWLTFNSDTHLHHALLMHEAETMNKALHIETRVDHPHDVTEVILYTPDHPGLFAKIAGVMSLNGTSIVDAKIMTMANGMALDTFWIQDEHGGAFANQKRLQKLSGLIDEALSGKIYMARDLEALRRRALPGRTQVFKIPPRVVVDNIASAKHTVIEVNGRDRPGFLHDVTAQLTALGLQIVSAHISTYGERVVDVFYVKDVFGLKVEHEEKLKEINQRLSAAIAPAADDVAAE